MYGVLRRWWTLPSPGLCLLRCFVPFEWAGACVFIRERGVHAVRAYTECDTKQRG